MATQTVTIAGIEGGSVPLRRERLSALVGGRNGRVLFPDDSAFADATRAWNGMVAGTPALVVQPATADAVADVVRFADDAVAGDAHRAEAQPVDRQLAADVEGVACHRSGVGPRDRKSVV